MPIERINNPTLSVELFGQSVVAPITPQGLTQIEDILFSHKKGFAIALSLGLVATAGAIINKRHQEAKIQEQTANTVFKDTIPLTDDEAELFKVFFKDTAGHVLAVARSVGIGLFGHNDEIAKDLVSGIYLRFLEHWPEYTQKSDYELRQMLFTSFYNAHKNLKRDGWKKLTLSIDQPDSYDRVLQLPDNSVAVETEALVRLSELEEHQAAQAILVRLNSLDEKNKLILLLAAAGLDQSSISKIFNTSLGAVKLRWHRILVSLRRDISKIKKDEDEQA